MARIKKSDDEAGVNLDSLMDALTNVVGILIIVFIMVQLNVAQAVKEILSELPEVTQEELIDLEQDATEKQEETTYLEEDWKEKQDVSEKTYAELKVAKEEKRRLEETYKKNKVEVIDLDSLLKEQEKLKLAIADKQKEEDAMLAKIEELERSIADTPTFVAAASKVVRMPNPRPIPEGGIEYKFLVANNKVAYVNESEYAKQIIDEFERIKDQTLWQDPPAQPYAKTLAEGLGDKEQARKLWPAFQALSSHFQMHDITAGLAKFKKLGFELNSKTVDNLASLAGYRNQNLTDLADAIEAFEKNNDFETIRRFGIWSSEPEGGKMKLGIGEDHRGEASVADPKAGLRAFLADLGDAREIRRAYRQRTIHDGRRIEEHMNERSERGGIGDRNYISTVKYTETSTRLRNEVSLREGAGEGPDDIKDPASTFQRALRKIASEENSYVWFYVKGDSFDMYLDARNLADEMKALAGWEPWGADFFVQTIVPIEVAALKTTPPKKSGAAGKTIKGVGKTLD